MSRLTLTIHRPACSPGRMPSCMSGFLPATAQSPYRQTPCFSAPKDYAGSTKGSNVNPLRLPARSPNLNSYAERCVRSVKEECLSRLILVGESSLRRALQQYIVHYHEERNHQGKDNRILFPSRPEARRKMGAVRCRERLGGVLKYYEREAA